MEDQDVSGKVVSVGDDVFFWSSIHDAAQRAGRPAARVSDEAGMSAAFAAGAATLVVVDLALRTVDVLAWAKRFKEAAQPPRLLGYASHVDVATHERARAAGFDVVVPKSRFAAALALELASTGPSGTPQP
jgi:hypothetical protein